MSVPGTYSKARPTGRRIDVIWEPSTTHVIVHPDGRETDAMIAIIPEEDFPGLRQGYICAQCIEELDMAFPEHCPVCNFPMRDHQTEYIAKVYQGNVKTGPSTTLEDEKLRMQEMRAREAHALGIWTPPSSWSI